MTACVSVRPSLASARMSSRRSEWVELAVAVGMWCLLLAIVVAVYGLIALMTGVPTALGAYLFVSLITFQAKEGWRLFVSIYFTAAFFCLSVLMFSWPFMKSWSRACDGEVALGSG